MIGIQVHCKHALMTKRLDKKVGNRALLQALPFALNQVWDRFGMRSHAGQDRISSRVSFGYALPSKNIIAEVMAAYLSLKEKVDLKELPAGTLVADQPVVQLWLEHEASISVKPHSGFMVSLSEIVADILALSLFHSSLESLLIFYEPERRWIGIPSLVTTISEILAPSEAFPSISTTDILIWALNFISHKVRSEVEGRIWIASSSRGQVVFPEIFEAESLRRHGFLGLSCLQGTFITGRRSTKQLSLVTASEGAVPSTLYAFGPYEEERPASITGSLDMYSKADLSWKMCEEQDRITVAMKWDDGVHERNPFDVIRGLKHAYFLDCCPHKPDTSRWTSFKDNGLSIENIADLSELGIPGYDDAQNNNIIVYAAGGNERLQMIALSLILYRNAINSHQSPIIINKNACLNCLLAQCHLLDSPFLIL